MKSLLTTFVMSTIIGLVVTSQQDVATGSQLDANTTLMAAEDATPNAIPPGCYGTAPCCDFNDDGTCNLKMFCWFGQWTCP